MGARRKLILIFLILCIGVSVSRGDSDVEAGKKKNHRSTSLGPTASPPLEAPSNASSEIKKNDTALTGSNTSNDTVSTGSGTSNDTVSTTADGKKDEAAAGSENKDKDGEQSDDRKDQKTPPENEEKEHCCQTSKVRACLSSPGDASNEILSLVIKSRSKVNVEIITPGFLSADPATFTTEDGKDVSVRIEMVDLEAAKQQTSSTIRVKSEADSCDLPVPSKNLGYHGENNGFSYSTLRTPVVGFSMLAAALVLVLGSWAYHRYRVRKARHGETGDGAGYMDLEMGRANLASENSTAEADDSWDQGWEDDWDDSGNSQFKLTESLSGKGLAARRTAKAD